MNKKVLSYLGFAKKSGNLLTGFNTCVHAMRRKKVKLMVLAEDISENSRDKIMKEIARQRVDYVVYGRSEELSHAVGAAGRYIFALCDDGLAGAIMSEIERESE